MLEKFDSQGGKEHGELTPLKIIVSSFALSHIEAAAVDAGEYAKAINSGEFRMRFVHYAKMIEDATAAEGISRILGRIVTALNTGENFTFGSGGTPETNPLVDKLKTSIIEGVFDLIIPCNETDPKQKKQIDKVIKAVREGRDIVLVSSNSKQATN